MVTCKLQCLLRSRAELCLVACIQRGLVSHACCAHGVVSTVWPRYFERRAHGDVIGAGRSNPVVLLIVDVFLASHFLSQQRLPLLPTFFNARTMAR